MEISFENLDNLPEKVGLTTKFWFGKYQGRYVRELIDENPRYVQWCIKNYSGGRSFIPNANVEERLKAALDELDDHRQGFDDDRDDHFGYYGDWWGREGP